MEAFAGQRASGQISNRNCYRIHRQSLIFHRVLGKLSDSPGADESNIDVAHQAYEALLPADLAAFLEAA